MLNILEKIQFGLSALVLLGSLGAYVLWGIDTRPASEVEAVRPVSSPVKALGKPGAKAAPAPAPAPASKEDQDLLKRLTLEQKVAVGGKKVEHVPLEVPKDTYEYIAREPNLKPELEKLGHELLPGADGRLTRIRIKNVDSDSILKKFGFDDGDIFEYIDGERIDFQDNEMNHLTRWSRMKDKLARGEKFAVTITRNGQPMQMEFQVKR
jgi:hypothetical protein